MSLSNPPAKSGTIGSLPNVEEVSFIFQTIEIINNDGKTAAMDSLAIQ